MKFSEFTQKEVINVCDCKVLGEVCNLIFDQCTGRIISVIVPGPPKLCGMFCRDSEYIIPWECIRKIGDDIILVEIRDDKSVKKNI